MLHKEAFKYYVVRGSRPKYYAIILNKEILRNLYYVGEGVVRVLNTTQYLDIPY